MPDRARDIAAFLAGAGWADATRTPLAGDASARRYERLTQGAESAILMDAPPAAGNDTRPFARIGKHLLGGGLSAPHILAHDPALGLMLLEDLGDALFAHVMAQDPFQERALYFAAVDALAALHRLPIPHGVPSFTPRQMAEMTDPAFLWYAKGITGTAAGLNEVIDQLETHLKAAQTAPVLALRDFHAENLLWLPDRDGVQRVGLLDFQDGFAGHPAYDLVSLTEDARRDVDPTLADDLLAHYIAQTGQDTAAFRQAAATSAAQRNLRILGVFARLSLHFGKPDYVDLIPRVWDQLQRDLSQPHLRDLRDLITVHLPAPSPENLQILRDKCATIPTL
ncbi:phosphotransferase [Aliiroseovarius subalbicans]|uniref:aminoglycoside phosphotransferase family protein n=1 Tax=Aliiroseovarius subalbicans TaxID=2925840 RepID=UPI001F579A28|nr:phosphotransferase [Aliiroseovarius subalbicans]MCI2400031.1 phosphotransferase [Aliiroseovarius subalbicans]